MITTKNKEKLVLNKKIIYQRNTYILPDGYEKLHEEETGRKNSQRKNKRQLET